MQIVAENQQLTVRIITELPVVRDMIETNLHQLKSELQGQGLQVERIEVAVADDRREHPWRQARNGIFRKAAAAGRVSAADRPLPDGHVAVPDRRSLAGRQAAIDMFV
jgi:hypothetical protein